MTLHQDVRPHLQLIGVIQAHASNLSCVVLQYTHHVICGSAVHIHVPAIAHKYPPAIVSDR